jgi:3-oxoacyl-[acyl-carrier-protein] synthase-1
MSPVSILGAGAATPLGHDARATAAAARAGVVRFRELNEVAERSPRVSCLASIPWGRSSAERARELARLALVDLFGSLPCDRPGRLAAWVGVPEPSPAGDAVERALSGLLPAEVPGLGESTFLHLGRGAFFAALAAAHRALLACACDFAIVGAADSLCAPERLHGLAGERRLLGLDPEGLIPGEAAAFLLLGRQEHAARSRTAVLGSLLGCATAYEARHLRQSEPSTAEALTAVFRELRASPAARGRRVDLLFTCETGEPRWTEEFGLAYLRNVALMPEPLVRTVVAESFGDTGAAAGALAATLGLLRLAREVAAGTSPRLLMVSGSSDEGHVGACLIEGPPGR